MLPNVECVLLFGCEEWTINGQDKKKLKGMEMWTWRRMSNARWTERKSNVGVLKPSRGKRNYVNHHQSKKWKNVRSLT